MVRHRKRAAKKEPVKETNAEPKAKPKASSKRVSFWSSGKFIFIIGGLIGSILGGHLFVKSDAFKQISTDANLDWLLEHRNLFPNSFLNDIVKFMNVNGTSEAEMSDSFAVGLALKNEGYKPRHPVILVPGVISTTLESWGLEGTEKCPSKPHYRKPLWGGWYMIKTMLTDKHCWLKHIMLDKDTGLDPANITVRPMQGLEAADFFITGYWIWNKIIENLSATGYEPNTMHLAAYDWRLGYPDLERRDGYFSELKALIERSFATTGEKTVLMGHSMGSQVIFYFLKWAEASGYGNGGFDWCEKYVEAVVDISGSMLGTPKAVTALMSGEMRDTIQLNQLAVYGLEKFFARHERREMLLTWPGIASMMPKGGEAIWGNLESAPDDTEESLAKYGRSYGDFVGFYEAKSHLSDKNLTVPDSISYLKNITPSHWRDRIDSMYSFGIATSRKELKANEANPSKWSNPLEVALPNAPSMKVYCFYGVGNPAERAYTYKDSTNDTITPLNVTMDFENDNVVLMGEGDGTVSLMTHSMCHIWKQKNSKYNPGNSEIKVVEMLHEPDNFDLRGGAKTAEHVDILGRTELNELVLRVSTGNGGEIEDRFVSNLTEYVKKIDLGGN